MRPTKIRHLWIALILVLLIIGTAHFPSRDHVIKIWEDIRSAYSRHKPNPYYKEEYIRDKYYPVSIPRKVSPEVLVPAMTECRPDKGVVYVKNRANGFSRRESLRQKKSILFGELPVIFVIGQLPWTDDGSVADRMKILEEARAMGDIYIGDFEDKYENLTAKAFFTLDHFVNHCDAPFAVLIDDDTEPNLNTGTLEHLARYSDDAVCLMLEHDEGGTPFRDPNPKRAHRKSWYVSFEDYPWDTYPRYCNGGCWGLARQAAIKMMDAAKHHETNFTHIDDVFITGVLRELGGVGLSSRGNVCTGHSSEHSPDGESGPAPAQARLLRKPE